MTRLGGKRILETERLALEVEDKVAELEDLSCEVKELREKMPKECQKAFDEILSGKGHEGEGRVWELSLVEMLGHKGEIYSQAIIELGFQLMAMRLTADQAVNVTRAFVQLQHPAKVEGEDYRIPSAAHFREWRRYLEPICHYISISVDKLAALVHCPHDATTKMCISVIETAFRCELKDKVTGKITIVNGRGDIKLAT